jgi:anaerobic ribonucleoside-triphosphate reductase activating protein
MYKVADIKISFNSTITIGADVFFAGCNRKNKCTNCHNPELWDRNSGNDMDKHEILSRIEILGRMVKSVALMGGEPLDRNGIMELVDLLKKRGYTVWLYTGYQKKYIPERLLKGVDYLKEGQYIEELKSNKSCFIASVNQNLWQNVNGKWVELIRGVDLV